MNKKIIAILSSIIVLLGGGAYAVFGGFENATTNYQVLAGTPDELTAMPSGYNEATSTAVTALGYDAGSAGVVRQDTEVSGISQIGLLTKGVGGTATSTLFTKFQGSMDGTNFFDIVSTTDTISATTTPSRLVKVLAHDFGTVTSSKMWIIDIPPIKWLRTVFYGENLATDSNDGVQAYIQITKIQ